MDIDPKEFIDVSLNVNQPQACSPPEPQPGWLGLVIRGPRRVSFKAGESVGDYGAFAAIPICGYFLVEVVPGDNEPMKLVAVDHQTGKVSSGPIVELDPSPVDPPPEIPAPDASELRGMASGGYFNPNLADFVQLPHVSASYDVHVEYRQYKSNSVHIELVEEP